MAEEPEGAATDDPAEQLARLGDGLRDAQRLLAGQPPETRKALQDRLIVVTNAAKHDAATALRRLDRLLADLREGGAARG